ncbi:unnamed protein product [Blepharisma stoltei]|uniref:Uncharacterized protein n=1 Tax=Blepharisma stoltei TaxID=1481888 RepID=A0AAU9KN80_9CILI|nr:unnamed protein product [Blepharisma stoltei]
MELETEDTPAFISDSTDYDIFLHPIISLQTNSGKPSLLLHTNEIEEIPGGWLYRHYTNRHLILLRSLHIAGYGLELGCFIAGECLVKFEIEYDNFTPFAVDPIFVTFLWGLILLLGALLIPVLFRKTNNAISIISDQLKYYHFPVYILIAIFLLSKNVFKTKFSFIFNDLTLIIISGLSFYIYSRVKYEDDGRYVVTWLEYLGIQVQFSVIVAWMLVELSISTMLTISSIDGQSTKDYKFVGWPHENWTILLMSICFTISVIVLNTYKDIFFPAVLSYTFLGIYSWQRRKICLEDDDNCSESVTVTAFVFGGLLLVFIIITILYYPKLILYRVRVRT